MLPFISLDKATKVGPGKVRDLECVYRNHLAAFRVVGTPKQQVVALMGSLDGEFWFGLEISTAVGSVHVRTNNAPVRYVRADVTYLVGDAPVEITAVIGSC